MNSGVYTITNRENGDQYIGSSVNLRARRAQHKSRLRHGKSLHRHLQSAWNKYGEQAFEFSTLLFCDRALAPFYEQRAINVLRPRYNIVKVVLAPMTGRKHTPEAKAKVSASLIGNRRSVGNKILATQKASISAANTGHSRNRGFKHTEETKRKVSIASTGRWHTDDTKRRISETLRGHSFSDVSRAKMSASRTGRKQSEQTRMRRSISMARAWERRKAMQHEPQLITQE